jgi:membrane protease YdiL (CAAX protease family)
MEAEKTLPAVADDVAFSVGQFAAKAAQQPYRAFMRTVVTPRFGLFVSLAGALLGSQMAFLLSAVAGVCATVMALAVCMIIALRSEAARFVALSVGIAPAATLVMLGLPSTDPFAQSLLLYSILLALTLVYRSLFIRAQRPAWVTAAAPRYVGFLPAAVVLGQLLGILSFWLLGDRYPYADTSVGIVWACAVLFALAEELFFRGLIQRQASLVLHPIMAAALSAIVFASFGIAYRSWAAAGVALITGTVLSGLYYMRQSIVITVVANTIAKFAYIALLANFTWHYF